MEENIFIQIAAIAITSVVTIIGYHFKNRGERDKMKYTLETERVANTNRDKLLREELKSINNILFEIKDDVSESKKQHNDEYVLSNTISEIVLDAINFNENLDPFLKSLLNSYGNELDRFANRWRTHVYRGIAHKMKIFIRLEIDGIIYRAKNYMEHISPKTRNYIYGGGKDKTIDFLEFMSMSPAFNELEKLALVLEKNGLETNEEVTEVFSEYIGNFFRALVHSLETWNNLKLPNLRLPYDE